MSKESAPASAAATKAAEVGSEERSRCYLHTSKFRKWINVMHHGDKCWKDSKEYEKGVRDSRPVDHQAAVSK
ncbi:hypothetical protein D5086_030339 [Populus alba]|uniref:Uncharacterized protein n=2 Tax=Populus TaxID=3689 RepID=A0ACC4AN73_POPAL|nr:hypothetical protein NC653_037739 [Populus alba x Populus x berolinensis]